VIGRLAREFDAVLFKPHVTLGFLAQSPAVLPLINTAPIRLRPLGIFASASFTKTLFVRFAMTSVLEHLRDSLGFYDRRYDPHLSLLYQTVPMEQKTRLAESISLPFSTVIFDQISIVRCTNPTRTRDDVEAWEHMRSKKLQRGTAEKNSSRTRN
jgi:2'-5' RNA ligase